MKFFITAVMGCLLELLVWPMSQKDQEPNALPQPFTRTVYAKITAYDPYSEICVGSWAHVFPRRTATGADAEKPGLGADFDWFPPGTRVKIPGVGLLTVDDTGGGARQAAKRGIAHFDVRMPRRRGETNEDAYRRAVAFGMRWEKVEIFPAVQ